MLTDNIMFLKQNYPVLLENLRDKDNDDTVEIEETRNGQKTLKLKKDDSFLYLHSKYNPIREAESIIDKLGEKEDIDEDSHIIFYGLGLGYHIEIFTKIYPDVKFSLYEPSVGVFNKLLSNKSLKDLGTKNIKNIACEYDSNVRSIFLKKNMKNKDEQIIILDLPIYEKAFEKEHKSFFEDFRDAIKNERSSLHTNYAFQKRWIINSMKNLKEVLNTPNILLEKKGKFKDKPAILVAAGPSLNEEIENIRHIKENGLAYIFAVGSAINTLIHHHIYPDAMTSYDPTERNQIVFEKLKEKNIKEIPLIFGTSIGHEILEDYPGELYHMRTSQDLISNYFLEEDETHSKNIVQDAPSIAVVTLQMLRELKFNPIILAGQNLAYKGKAKHSDGISYSSELTESERDNGVWIKDVEGNEILTDEGFNRMRQQMESYIRLFTDTKVINTTAGGADIEGTEFKPLKEVINTSLKETVVDKDWLQVNSKYEDNTHLKSQLRKMNNSYKRALKINKEYNSILKRIEALISRRNFNQLENMYIKLDKELNRIEKNDFYQIFILPMNRVQYKILAESIDYLNSIKNPSEKGKRIVEAFRTFMSGCSVDIDSIDLIYHEMKDNIENHINKDTKEGESHE